MGTGSKRGLRLEHLRSCLAKRFSPDFPTGGGDEGENVNGVSGAKCPECSGYLLHQEGCLSCPDCGYNKCE